MSNVKQRPNNIIDIPLLNDGDRFDKNREKAESNKNDYCPCCGREIKNPKFFINSIWGGNMYPKHDKVQYPDTWVMGVGSECRKKLPADYVMTLDEL
jgi:hypothetical protein